MSSDKIETEYRKFKDFEDFYIKEKWLTPPVDIDLSTLKYNNINNNQNKSNFNSKRKEIKYRYPKNIEYNLPSDIERPTRIPSSKHIKPLKLSSVEDNFIYNPIRSQQYATSNNMYQESLVQNLLHPKGYENLNPKIIQVNPNNILEENGINDPNNIHYFDLDPIRATERRRVEFNRRKNRKHIDTTEADTILDDSFSNSLRSFDKRVNQFNPEILKEFTEKKYISINDQFHNMEDSLNKFHIDNI